MDGVLWCELCWKFIRAAKGPKICPHCAKKTTWSDTPKARPYALSELDRRLLRSFRIRTDV
jgi:hypothetical protein